MPVVFCACWDVFSIFLQITGYFLVSFQIFRNSSLYMSPPQNKDVDLLDIHSFNLTEAINTLYVTQPPIPESLSVFIIQGFSRCLKRLITPHPGCRGCLNFAKLSPAAFLSALVKKKKKKLRKSQKWLFSFFLISSFPSPVPPFSSAHSVPKNKREAGLTENRFSQLCFLWLLFLFGQSSNLSAHCLHLIFLSLASTYPPF